MTSRNFTERAVQESGSITGSIGPISSTQGLVLQRIRVLLVDDHAMLRKGLQTLLNSYDNLDIIGEAGDGKEAVSMAERMLPNVVVMDINMPKLNGIEATRQILKTAPAIKIIC